MKAMIQIVIEAPEAIENKVFKKLGESPDTMQGLMTQMCGVISGYFGLTTEDKINLVNFSLGEVVDEEKISEDK